MSSHIDTKQIEHEGLRQVWSVRDFARRHRLDKEEEKRLLALFGSFATKQELLANAQRPCLFR
ncbi:MULTISPECIES: hypothetical protein [Rhizobium]|uniref:Uncharacterized protein n=1 Tax=Rhizobium favelukesii TaxID=348824 RepID=W6RFV9_9HYPH|nr:MULTISPECIES: hypothetical protein [Rhizobium]MCA0803251.1 hypothetical protein [Rhizobium sp. T1473]MCS0460550.1 hypothetical protein [Rhizobium favelukesii]UFS83147.1 hypothetical protein LPB79_12915 [Rhizobium sp. T136]CDM59225.1 hypothetical protein LPU83_3582 [Rhizobium favelukesii]